MGRASLIRQEEDSIESESFIHEAIKNGKVGAAGLDVYEEESDLFFEDTAATG